MGVMWEDKLGVVVTHVDTDPQQGKLCISFVGSRLVGCAGCRNQRTRVQARVAHAGRRCLATLKGTVPDLTTNACARKSTVCLIIRQSIRYRSPTFHAALALLRRSVITEFAGDGPVNQQFPGCMHVA